jgi:hypothetical protein
MKRELKAFVKQEDEKSRTASPPSNDEKQKKELSPVYRSKSKLGGLPMWTSESPDEKLEEIPKASKWGSHQKSPSVGGQQTNQFSSSWYGESRSKSSSKASKKGRRF